MHSERYPVIVKNLLGQNKEIPLILNDILMLIEHQFADLFSLETLNDADKNSSYFQLFSAFVTPLLACATINEVVETLYETINHKEDWREHALLMYHFVPGKKPQIGFIEKLALGQLTTAEPLSFLDMLRAMHGLHEPTSSNRYSVVKLAHLSLLNTQKDILLVDLNTGQSNYPKWAIIDARSDSPLVYCESHLSLRDKEAIANQLNQEMQGIRFHSDESPNATTSGYKALAWLDTKYLTSNTFYLQSDFCALQYAFMQALFAHKETSYQLLAQDEEACSPSFQWLINTSSSFNESLLAITMANSNGFFNKTFFDRGHICSFLDHLHKENVSLALLDNKNEISPFGQHYFQAARSFLPGFLETAGHFVQQTPEKEGRSLTLKLPGYISEEALIQQQQTHSDSKLLQKILQTEEKAYQTSYHHYTQRRPKNTEISSNHIRSMIIFNFLRGHHQLTHLQVTSPSRFTNYTLVNADNFPEKNKLEKNTIYLFNGHIPSAFVFCLLDEDGKYYEQTIFFHKDKVIAQSGDSKDLERVIRPKINKQTANDWQFTPQEKMLLERILDDNPHIQLISDGLEISLLEHYSVGTGTALIFARNR